MITELTLKHFTSSACTRANCIIVATLYGYTLSKINLLPNLPFEMTKEPTI